MAASSLARGSSAQSGTQAPCVSTVGPGIPPPGQVVAGIPGLHAAWYGQSGYSTLCPGDSSLATVAFYNSGSIGWVSGRMGEMAFLGTWNPDPGQDQPTMLGGDGTNGSPNTGWPRYNRVAAQPSDYVGPGQVAWFQFVIRAPQTPGTYRISIRPLVEGAQWLEDYGVFWYVTVSAATPPPPPGGTASPTPSGTASPSPTASPSGAPSPTASPTPTPSGPITSALRVSTVNSHYFTDATNRAIVLTGSHTWNDSQDTDTSSSPAAFNFAAYVNFLKAHGQNMTILWHKDLPQYCGWGAGGTWTIKQFPWLRSGAGLATDGKPRFDLTQFDQAYFDRLRAQVVQLQQNGIYATVQLFDGLGLLNNRCSTDGYPFTGPNNVNGIDDGGGTSSMDLSHPAITGYQDAYVRKVIDTLNDLPNVLWEPSEEAPASSAAWNDHMINLIHSYEAAKPLQHPVGYAALTGGSDATLFASAAEWVAPGAKFPSSNNQGKVVIDDSDHSYFGMWNDSPQVNRQYVWENFTNGVSVIFMDPYEIYWSTGNRNLCPNPVNGVCSGVDPRWDNLRNNLGYTRTYGAKMDLAHMTPQSGRASTGYALANLAAVGAEDLVYAPNGGSFTVNLSNTTATLAVEWLNPSTGAITSAGTIAGGSASQSFTPPFSGDAVLYLH